MKKHRKYFWLVPVISTLGLVGQGFATDNETIGNINLDGVKGTITFPKNTIQGFDAETEMDGINHSLRLGLIHFDGQHGNIYTSTEFAQNTVGTRSSYVGGIADSNIALGSGNVAGVELEAIKKKVVVDGGEKEVTVDYKRERKVGNGYIVPLWNIDTANQRNYSTAIGFINAAYGVGAFAMGQYSVAHGEGAFAGGWESKSTADKAFAFGDYSKALAEGAVALGKESEAYGDQSFAAGNGSQALAGAATAFGYKSKAQGSSSFAAGDEVDASGDYSVAMGGSTKASASGSVALGYGSEASGDYSFVGGLYSEASGDYSVALGLYAKAKANRSLALNGGTVENNATSGIAIGTGSSTKVSKGIALGAGSLASREKNILGLNLQTNTAYTDESIANLDKKISYDELKQLNSDIEAKQKSYDEAYDRYIKAKSAHDQ